MEGHMTDRPLVEKHNRMHRAQPGLSRQLTSRIPQLAYEPYLEHYQLLVKGYCNDFAITEKRDMLLVYHRQNDIIHIVDGRDLEAYVQRPRLEEEINDTEISIIHPIELRSQNPHGDAFFIQNGKMILFKSPDGMIKRWYPTSREFDELDDSPALQSMKHPLLDPVKEKLYYFTQERELKAMDADFGTSETLAVIDCDEINNAMLVAGLEYLIIIHVDKDELLLHNLHTGKTDKASSQHRADLFPSNVINSLVMRSDRSLEILNLDRIEAEAVRVFFTTPQLKQGRPQLFAPNNSNQYYAVAFEDGTISLIVPEERGWREECIIAYGQDFLNYGSKLVKIMFSMTGEFLYAQDSQNNLHKFLIRENLSFLNEINILSLQRDRNYNEYIKPVLNNNSYNTDGDSIRQSQQHTGEIKDLNRNYARWLGRLKNAYQIQSSHQFPLDVLKIPTSNRLISLDSDGSIRVWDTLNQACQYEIKKHLGQFGGPAPLSFFHWRSFKIYVAVYKQVIILVDERQLTVIGHILLDNEDHTVRCQSFGDILYIATERGKTLAIEFINQPLKIKASRAYPCTFPLYLPKEGKLVLYPGTESACVPFYPSIFKRHAFEKSLNLYSPVIFWYKFKNYKLTPSSNLKLFVGHQNILFHSLNWNLPFLYAKTSKADLLAAALKRGVPLIPDLENESPLSISIKRKAVSCTHVILNHFITSESSSFYNDTQLIEECKDSLPKESSPLVPKIYKSLQILPQQKQNLPHFVHLGGKDQIIMSVKNQKLKDVLDKNVNTVKEDDIVTYLLSKWEFDMTFGSRTNIDFIDGIIASKHLEIFEAPIVQAYIRYLWRTARYFFFIEAFLFIIYLLFLSLHAVVLRDEKWSVIAILLLSLIQVAQELWQIIAQGFKTYFEDMWNLVDYFSLMSIWFYCIFYLTDVLIDVRLWLLTFSLLQLWWKSFSYTRFSNSNRFFIHNFVNILVDIGAFLGFMLIYTIAFSVVFFASERDPEFNDHSSFTNKLFDMYKFTIGKSDPSGTTLQDFVYIPATIAVSVMLFNLLIAMIRDSFLKNKINRVPNDYKEIATIISDYQMMAMWNLKKPKLRYIFVCQNANKSSGINGLVFVRPQNAAMQGGGQKSAESERVAALQATLDKIMKRIDHIEHKLAATAGERFRQRNLKLGPNLRRHLT